MKKLISMIALVVMLQGVALADIWVEPYELTRGIFLTRIFKLYISINATMYQINPETNVEFGPPTSGIYLGHVLDPKSGGLYAFGLLWPAIVTRDTYLEIRVYGGDQGGKLSGVGFGVNVKTFLLGGGQ